MARRRQPVTSAEKVITLVDGHGWTRRLARKYKAAKNRYSRFCDKHGFVIPPSFASTKAEKKVRGKAFELWKSQDKAWMRLNKFCRNLRIKYGLKYGASESEVGTARMKYEGGLRWDLTR
jgi:hypothetical protein